jgi:isoquinoline 1-oxidoreductase beta subunit
MRRVGAAAREMLLQAAADTWQVKKEDCRAENGAVIHTSGKKFTYGQLSRKAATMPVPTEISLKDPSAFKIIGKPTHRLDTREKIDGKAIFGIDARVQGVLIGLVARSPVFGGKVKSFDGEKAKAIPGVKEVVRIESGVAVVADHFWAAKKARDVLDIVWDEGTLANLSTASMRKEYGDLAQNRGAIARKEGDLEKAFATPGKELAAEYEVPYLAHATMEPLNCLVDLRANQCEIWTGTQMQTGDRNAAARILGMKPVEVKIHTTFLGGGFGRRAPMC